MIDLLPLGVLMTAYAPDDDTGRRRLASEVVALFSWEYFLSYGGKAILRVQHDGLPMPKYQHHLKEDGLAFGNPITYGMEERGGVGRSLNYGLRYCFNYGSIVAYFVDDWALKEPFDITPFVVELLESETVGMIQLGNPHSGYSFLQRPFLIREDWFNFYGPFSELVSADFCESQMNSKYLADNSGPRISRVEKSPFLHVGTENYLSSVSPI